jgi:DnaJ-class molecular chaperone
LKDPYTVLGLARGVDADQIKQAYRALARELHPDVNPGNKKAEERFKEITAAYDLLSDSEKRGKFDRGEIDASGQPQHRAHSTHRKGGPRGAGPGAGFGGFGGFGGGAFDFGSDPNEILAEMMRRKEKGKKSSGPWGFGTTEDEPSKGQDAHHSLKVSFQEAAKGITKRVTLATGKSVDVRIPPGSLDGQTLRLKGQGFTSMLGPPGDAFIDIIVEVHPHLVRRDLDYILDLPISVQEAVLGAKITVPTVDGHVALTIPPNSNTGTVLRLKGKGVKVTGVNAGDQLVTLKVVLPEDNAEFRKLVEKWGGSAPYNPREKMKL